MSRLRGTRAVPRGLAWLVLVVASVLLVGSVAMTLVSTSGSRVAPAAPTTGTGHGPGYAGTSNPSGNLPGGGMGGGMMGAQQVWLAGEGVPVQTIAQARARAAQAAAARGLSTGEVMKFTRNFYVELKDSAGNPTTEVLVDPNGGSVSTEYGPAMMWNTGSRDATVSADQARRIADGWLRTNQPGQSTVADVKAFPGYYTIDTETNGNTVGMMSVNALTGAVWYHTWHGTFIAEEDD